MQNFLNNIYKTFGYNTPTVYPNNCVGIVKIAGYDCPIFRTDDNTHFININENYDSGVFSFKPPMSLDKYKAENVEDAMFKGLGLKCKVEDTLVFETIDKEVEFKKINLNSESSELDKKTDIYEYKCKENETFKELKTIEEKYPNLVIMCEDYIPKYKHYDGPGKDKGILQLTMVPVCVNKDKVIVMDNIKIIKRVYFIGQMDREIKEELNNLFCK